jgi:hypothetical protein
MRKLLIIFGVLCCTGCATREPQLYRVVDSVDFRPIERARVWMQPFAPIHPFWPAGDRGVTDKKGEVKLSLPNDFWFYLIVVKADGYTHVQEPDRPRAPHRSLDASPGTQLVFYMRRDVAGGVRSPISARDRPATTTAAKMSVASRPPGG